MDSNPVLVNCQLSGSATLISDYESPPGTWSSSGNGTWTGRIIIPSNSANVEFYLKPINDGWLENEETVVLTLLSASGCCCGGGSHTIGSPASTTVTIADNDNWTVAIQASDPNAAETMTSEQADPGQFTFTRAGETDLTHFLNVWYTISGIASMGSDYQYVSTIATIPAGQTSVTLPINVINDSLRENPETVTLSLSSVMGCCTGLPAYLLGSPASDTVTIADNDNWTVTIQATDPTAAERPVGQTQDPGVFTITRSGATDTSYALMVPFTVAGSAVMGADYSSFFTSVSIGAGYTSVTRQIDVIDDAQPETWEDVTLALSPPGACCGGLAPYTLGSPAAATVTIADNDGAVTWSVSITAKDNSAWESHAATQSGDKGTFQVKREGIGDSSQPLTVNYTISGGAINGADYGYLPGTGPGNIINGSVIIPANEQSVFIDVSPIYDGLNDEGDENVKVTLASGSGYTVGGSNNATVTIHESAPNTPKTQCPGCSDTNLAMSSNDGDGSLVLCYEPLCIGYQSGTNPHPISTTDVKLLPTNGAATLTRVEVTSNLDGVQTGTLYYSGTGVNANDVYRFSRQADASALSSGRHNWSMTILQRYSDGSTRSDVYYGQQDLLTASAASSEIAGEPRSTSGWFQTPTA